VITVLISLACTGSAGTADSGWEPETWDPANEVENAEVLAEGLEGPWGLAMSDEDLLIVERDAGRLVRLTAAGELETLAEGLDGCRWVEAGSDGAVVVGDTTAWWIDLDSGAVTVLTDVLEAGGPAALDDGRIAVVDPSGLWLGDSAGLQLTDLELDDPTDVTWSDDTLWIANAPGLVQATADGTWLAEIAVEDAPTAVVAEGSDLFLTATSSRWPYPGWVLGGPPDDLATLSITPPEPGRIALTEDTVYWASKQSITAVPREGGAYTVVGSRTAVEDLVVVAGKPVWTDAQRGLVLTAR
jgi:hypothetical protein